MSWAGEWRVKRSMLVLAVLAAPVTAAMTTFATAQQVTTPAPTTAAAASAGPPATSRPVAAQVSARPALPGISRPRQGTVAQEGVGKGAPVNGVLVIYGNERCPTNSDGDEIVVCERRSAEEQYRLPKELRSLEVTPENASWAANAGGVMATGASGIGSCSAAGGAGGAVGCMGQRDQAYRAAKRARQRDERQIP